MCVQQYQNKRYHPLLDWRLGLAYLRSMIDPSFQCGLDGDFDSFPELKGGSERRTHLPKTWLRSGRDSGGRTG